MPLDFAGLGALAGTDNWSEIKQSKERDAQRIAILNAMATQTNQKQQASAQEVQDYLSTVGQIKVLDQDKQRIQAKNDQLQKSIQEGVQNSHGNLQKYLETGGKTQLQAYRNNLLQSDEVQQGLRNSVMHNMAVADQQKGLNLRNTAWNEGDKQQTGTYGENYAAFQAGKTNQLNYAGSYKTPDIEDPGKYFAGIYGNAEHTPKSASRDEIGNYLVQAGIDKGLDPEDAKHYARARLPYYEKQNYQYKSDKQPSAQDIAYKTYRNEIERRKMEHTISNSDNSWDAITNPQNAIDVKVDPKDNKQVPPIMKVDDAAYVKQFGVAPPKDDKGNSVTAYYPIPLGEKERKNMATIILGVRPTAGQEKKDYGAGYTGKVLNGASVLSGVNMQPLKGDLNNYKFIIKDIDRTIVVPPPPGSNGKPKKYVQADVDLSRSDADELGIWEHSHIFPDRANKASEGAGRQGATTEGKLGRVFPLWIEIDNIPPHLQASYSKAVKYGQLSNAEPAEYLNEDAGETE